MVVFKSVRDKDMIENLQKNIRKFLEHSNASVHAFEKRAGISPSSVQNILLGRSRRPGVELVHAIAQGFGCSIEDLIGEGEESSHFSQSRLESYPRTIDLSLFPYIVEIVSEVIREKKIEAEKSFFFSIIEEVYVYALKSGADKIDKPFVEWFINFMQSNRQKGIMAKSF